MNSKPFRVIQQKRYESIKKIIEENIMTEEPILIQTPYAVNLKRIKITNIYIAPDSEHIDYITQLEKLLSAQNAIYYSYYSKLQRFIRLLISNKVLPFSILKPTQI